MIDSTERARTAAGRLAAAATIACGLVVLYILRPAASPLAVPAELRTLAEPLVELVDLTTVLAATVALSVVAMIRRLPYGVAAVLIVSVGANLTAALARNWVPDAPAALLPNGHVVAVTALYGSALLVCAPRFRPVLAGLGFVAVVAVTAAAVTVETTSPAGALAAIAVSVFWWTVASALMQFSPVAAERESLRPDTAAIALSRSHSHSQSLPF
ncbi:hypothetical protein G4H71_02735 [Rhodococcus triatomae]|uniref:Uncharacterized protein n=1 Tax=Rhodococcus triatomae TaxID=300028 RepID=A0A1G8LZC5_9NOCA|nr:hypothetical protein [Rhodococcus triatomae]QNG18237.1 hypothetical protein G4H72_05305 [Rhodococcus triatomae]QNG22092.1 hypothetical protein G4H71_02735 [Rhodococcus triatomae]SDI61039.1 hypothetical protein SAMN05444695_10956 [Rhodococcus triatomae]